MPSIAFRLKHGKQDPNAEKLKTTGFKYICTLYVRNSGDTSKIACTGIERGIANEIRIRTSATVQKPQGVLDQVKFCINYDQLLSKYNFTISLEWRDLTGKQFQHTTEPPQTRSEL